MIGQRWKTAKCCGRNDITCFTCHKHCRRSCWLLIAGIGLVLMTFTRFCTCGAPWSLSVRCNCFYHGKYICSNSLPTLPLPSGHNARCYWLVSGFHWPGERKSNPITGLDRPWGFQEVEAPIFQDNQHMKVVRLPALWAGQLYPCRKYSWYSLGASFLLCYKQLGKGWGTSKHDCLVSNQQWDLVGSLEYAPILWPYCV